MIFWYLDVNYNLRINYKLIEYKAVTVLHFDFLVGMRNPKILILRLFIIKPKDETLQESMLKYLLIWMLSIWETLEDIKFVKREALNSKLIPREYLERKLKKDNFILRCLNP